MTIGAENVILGLHHAGQGAHEHAAFAGQVTVHFLLEGGREEVAGADADAEGDATFLGATRGILAHGVARVDSSAGKEVAADIQARALGRDHDHVHVFRRDDARLALIDDGESVREVHGVAGFQVGLDGWPDFSLGGVGDKDLDDGAALDGLRDGEEGFTGDPAVLAGAVPVTLEFRCLADDDVEAIILQVKCLGGALDSVADDGDGFFFQDFARLGNRELLAGYHGFILAAKINQCHELLLVIAI